MKTLKYIQLIFLITTVCFLFGCNKRRAPRVVNVALIQKDSHPENQALILLGERFKELTNGRYEFKIYNDSALGTQRETLRAVQAGTVDMAVIGNSLVLSFEPAFTAFSIPYIFEDNDHYQRFFRSEYPAQLYTKTENYNFKILTDFSAGSRNFYTKKPIRQPADLKNLKIRTNESDINRRMMSALGATAQPMTLANVYDAIKAGTLDGAENNEPTYFSFNHFEVAPYFSQTRHLTVPDFLVMNMNFFLSLSDRDEAALLTAVREAEAYQRELWQQSITQDVALINTAGGHVITDVNIPAFKKALSSLKQEVCAEDREIQEVCTAVNAVK